MGDWETMALSSLQLTTPEHRYYGDIFIYCCENADTDLVPTAKVGKLLRSANLPSEVTLQVQIPSTLSLALSISLSPCSVYLVYLISLLLLCFHYIHYTYIYVLCRLSLQGVCGYSYVDHSFTESADLPFM